MSARKVVHQLNRHQLVGSMGRVGAAGDNAANLQDAARHRDGPTVDGQLADERVHIIFPADEPATGTPLRDGEPRSPAPVARSACSPRAGHPARCLRAEPEDRAELRSSITSHRFRHDGEMPKSPATCATEESEPR
jgi:hypothetical protein